MARKTRLIAQIIIPRPYLNDIEKGYGIKNTHSVMRMAITKIAKDLLDIDVNIIDYRDPRSYAFVFNIRTKHDTAMMCKLMYTKDNLESKIIEMLVGTDSEYKYISNAAHRYLAKQGRLCLLKNTQ